MIEIVAATNNADKLREIRMMVKGGGLRIMSLADIGFKGDIKETGETLAENAAIKARAAAKKAGKRIVIADDTGLEVDYLAKAPGVYSARFAGRGCTYEDNNMKLLKLMRGVPEKERTAVFRTVICLVFPGRGEFFTEGRVKGIITGKIRGAGGFGYDPVFLIPDEKKTLAEMTAEEKNTLSHRKIAVKKAIVLINRKTRVKNPVFKGKKRG